MVPGQPDTCSEITVGHYSYLIFGNYPATPYLLPITLLNSAATTLIFNDPTLFPIWGIRVSSDCQIDRNRPDQAQ